MAAIGVFGDPCISLHRAMIHDRGGVRRVAPLVDLSEVQWIRERDRIVGAHVVISGRACSAQVDALRRIASHRHELVIYRGDDRVWEGPILQVSWFSSRVRITAHNVGEYLMGTPLTKDWPNADDGGPVYMTERIEEIITYEMATPYLMDTGSGPVSVPRWEGISPPVNVLPFLDVRPSIGPQGILTRSSTLAFEMTLGEHLMNLAEGGLDFTVVGRSLLIWDSAQSIGRTRVLTDADFLGELQVIEAGSEQASIAHISAQREDDDSAAGVGNAGAPDPFYGVWTRLVSLASEEGTDTPSQLELNSQARRQLVGRNPAPAEVIVPEGGRLRLSHDLRINDLIPGVIMPIRATLNLREVAQEQRLDRLIVKETAAEGETVQVALSPAGAILEA